MVSAMSSVRSLAQRSVLVVAILGLGACSNLDETQQKMLSGGAAGAAIGAVGTVITGGCVACGAAIGGVVGAGTGYVLDKMDKNSKNQ